MDPGNPTGRCSCWLAVGHASSQGSVVLPARMWFSICRRYAPARAQQRLLPARVMPPPASLWSGDQRKLTGCPVERVDRLVSEADGGSEAGWPTPVRARTGCRALSVAADPPPRSGSACEHRVGRRRGSPDVHRAHPYGVERRDLRRAPAGGTRISSIPRSRGTLARDGLADARRHVLQGV
jgi:hypothetical protein